MGSDWRDLALGDNCSKIGSGATPRGGKDSYRGGKTTLIRSQNIYNNQFIHDGLVKINDKQADELRNVIIEENDILLNITGDSVARCCQVVKDVLPARVNQHVAIIRPDPKILDSLFLRYVLVSPAMQSYLLALSSAGATRNALTKGMLESLIIPTPPLPEQRAIAHILGTLDDKIELNRKRNETLEAMARALFKDWFVDFCPVRAKMDDRDPYLPAEIWDLFPEKLDEEGKPEGWKHFPFGELLEGTIGGDWGKESAENDHDQAVCIIRGTDIPDLYSGFSGKVPTRYTTEKKLVSRILMAGDIVVEVSGGSPTQPTGRSLQVSQSMLERFTHPVVCASFCRRFRPRNRELGLLAACHLTNLYRNGGTWEYQNQSTGISNFQTSHFLEAEDVLLPSQEVLEAFVRFVEPILAKKTHNESIVLTQLRDTLLPKLISGELRLGDVDSFIDRALQGEPV